MNQNDFLKSIPIEVLNRLKKNLYKYEIDYVFEHVKQNQQYNIQIQKALLDSIGMNMVKVKYDRNPSLDLLERKKTRRLS